MNRKRIKARKLSKKAVRELLQESGWAENQELMQKLTTATRSAFSKALYKHEDGRVLDVFRWGEGRLYPSQDEYMLLIDLLAQTKTGESHHILEGRLPQGQDFIQEVPQLVDQLAAKFKIPREELDNTVLSIEKVDAAIRKYGKRKSLELPIFPMLVAYVGEVMRHSTNGKWEMRLALDGETWEPWIIDPQGRSVNPFLAVYDELAEQYPFSITAVTGSRIDFRRVLPTAQSSRLGLGVVIQRSDE